MNDSESIKVLLIEDDPEDVQIIKEELKSGKIKLDLDVDDNAKSALDRMRDGYKPDLILLDLNLPGLDGRDFLKIIRNDPTLSDIPIFILTTSKSEHDIIASYNCSCSAYITKPLDATQFLLQIRNVSGLGFSVIKM